MAGSGKTNPDDMFLGAYAAWVGEVLSNKKDPLEKTVVLFGFLTNPRNEDQEEKVEKGKEIEIVEGTRFRLYLSIQMEDYLLIKRADIVHARSLTGFHGSLNGTLVWVRGEAPVQHVRTFSEARFLQGPISSAYQGGYGQGANMAGAGYAGPGGNATLACPAGGVTLACPAGGVTLACPAGGVTLACPAGGVSLVMCP